jgi:hypothetical protein
MTFGRYCLFSNQLLFAQNIMIDYDFKSLIFSSVYDHPNDSLFLDQYSLNQWEGERA